MSTSVARTARAPLMGSALIAATFTAPAEGQDAKGDSLAALQQGVMTAAWATSRDLGSRLYRHRAGIRPGTRMVEEVPPPPPTSAKGGMAKDAKVAAISAPVPNRWEVFGSLFYYSRDRDDSFVWTCPNKTPSRGVISTDSTHETWGGNVGVEYHLNSNWSIGLGVGGSVSELEQGIWGNADIDSFVISPYVSYYQIDALGKADFWASAGYSYGMHSLEIVRYTGAGRAFGTPDADTHQIEVVTGLNFGEGDFIHGPYAGLRWITGSIDGYSEVGPLGLFAPEQDLDSFVSILGYQASWLMRQGRGYWVPQLRLAWEHEFEDGSTYYGIPVEYGDSDYGVVGAGLAYWWDTGWHVGVEYEGRFSGDTESHYGGINAGKSF